MKNEQESDSTKNSPAPAPAVSSSAPESMDRSPIPASAETPASTEPSLEPFDAPVERLEPVFIEPPKTVRSFSDIEPLPHPSSNVSLDLPVFDPLFEPLWTRNIVAAAVATRLPKGPVDMPDLIDRIAWGRPVYAIPRFPQSSLFRGAQILVDIGEGMELFYRDQEHLLYEIRQAIGKESISTLRFRDNPFRGAGPGPVWTWQPYVLPAPGTPVMVISDLGIGGPLLNPDRSSIDEWLAFARKLREQSCPLIAFVPYPENRWPSELVKQIALVCWDRSTTVGTICRKIRHGHEVRL